LIQYLIVDYIRNAATERRGKHPRIFLGGKGEEGGEGSKAHSSFIRLAVHEICDNTFPCLPFGPFVNRKIR